MSAAALDEATLLELHGVVERAIADGDDQQLTVLGHGEVSLVVGWPSSEPRWAAKRLPVFPDRSSASMYRSVVERYVQRLRADGVDVVDTDVREVPTGDGRVCCYCVQPVLEPDALAPRVLRAGGPDASRLVERVVDRILGVVSPEVGLDAQISNWALVDGKVRYLDVTTPLLRDPSGSDLLDTRLFLAALPAVLRSPVHRLVIPGIIARYHDPRSVVLDVAANLHKERLEAWIPAVLELANPRLAAPITPDEVAADYRSDARLWEVMLRIRRLDRWWQRRVRRRPYPFLLPRHVER